MKQAFKNSAFFTTTSGATFTTALTFIRFKTHFPMNKKLRIISFILFSLIINLGVFAQSSVEPEAYYDEISFVSNELPSLTLADSKYTEIGIGEFTFKNKSVRNKISLQIDPSETDINFEMDVVISGYYYTYVNNEYIETKFDKTLKVGSINQEIRIKDNFYFTGAHFVQVQVDDVTFISGSQDVNLILSIDIEVERCYNMKLDAIPENITSDLEPDSDGNINFKWDVFDGAIEYDFEWVFINNYDRVASTINFDHRLFEYNATRVTLPTNSYSMPYIYGNGYLIYRVRAVGKSATNNFLYNLPGAWSFDPTAEEVSSLEDVGNKLEVQLDDTYNDLNWQYTVSYAEGGKSKVVGSYFDGSLRNRQTVTRTNTNNKVLVGEIIYDHQGRAAISVLPVPATGNSKLEYKEEFNIIDDVDGLRPYSRDDFDKDGTVDVCSNTPLPMNEASGAANYYSSSNVDMQNSQLYLPNAQGFPFVQTEFMADNTGRIKAQGGAGSQYQLGNSEEHVTRYYYATPEQNDLNKMFGSEAGVAKHFKKNMVKDPNGQLSISYLDMAGNVVASALSGGAPDNLHTIPTYSEVKRNTDLLNKKNSSDLLGQANVIDYQNSKIILKRPLVVSVPEIGDDARKFTYNFTGSTYTNTCERVDYDEEGVAITTSKSTEYAGVYDLSVRLLSQCGDNFIYQEDASLIDATIGTPITAVEGVEPAKYSDQLVEWTSNELEPGTYQLIKEISVNQEALDEYLNLYIDAPENICSVDLSYFIKREFLNASFEGCFTEAGCKTVIRDYVEELNKECGCSNEDCDNCISEEEIKVLTDQCHETAQGDDYKSKSFGLYLTMLADVSPMGQYGRIRQMGGLINGGTSGVEMGEIDPSLFSLSVYNEGNRLPIYGERDYPNWRYPYFSIKPGETSNIAEGEAHYYDKEGNVAKIQLIDIGDGQYEPAVVDASLVDSDNKTEPQNLEYVEDFLAYFNPEWSHSLVVYHPEYQHLTISKLMEPSYAFDYKWLEMDLDAAVSEGYTTSTAGAFAFRDNDPLFNGKGVTFIDVNEGIGDDINDAIILSLGNAMQNAMDNYIKDEANGNKDIWYAVYQTLYDPVGCLADEAALMTKRSQALTDDVLNYNKEWELYKFFYNGLKTEVVQKFNIWASISRNYYNKCIGTKGFNPFKNNFIKKFYVGVLLGLIEEKHNHVIVIHISYTEIKQLVLSIPVMHLYFRPTNLTSVIQ